jgi:hypothetical protein
MSQDPHDRAKTSAAAHGARPTRERADRTGRRSLEPAELASLRETPLVRDTRPGGLGLRAQIGMALSTTLALSVVLIALATDRLSTCASRPRRCSSTESSRRSSATTR